MAPPSKNTASKKSGSTRAPKVAQIERTKKALMMATMELLSEIGYRSLTIELITQRAGVARSTLYRHWNNIPELAMDAFDMAIGPNQEFKEKEDVRQDLLTLYRGVAKALGRSVWARALPALIEASHNEPMFHDLLHNMHKQRRRAARQMLKRAKKRGELKSAARIEWILDSISGPLYFRLLISGAAISEPGFIKTLIDNALNNNLAK